MVLLESTSSQQLLEGKVEAVSFAKQRESLKPSRLFVFWWWKGSRALRVEERRQHERLFQVLFDHSELQLWNWQCASPTRCVGTRHTRKIASQWEMICQLSCPWWELLQAFETSRCMHLHVQMFSEEREAEGFGNIKLLRWYSLILFFFSQGTFALIRWQHQESPAQFSTLFFVGLHFFHRIMPNPSVPQDLLLRLWTSLHGTLLPMAARSTTARFWGCEDVQYFR